ncbi:hypothetical protein GWK08_11870 [Leptobacterium flavescens]|uniref:Uncharacterized protein n=1 Tax=Leptobacterium flavescens TaxID=472055 RepID=A0A6P0UNR9_9FLAO|nr:hypothetical protein [Leptobacterium flavescens]NER14142.1 hypothetical protein [Leptobacterium flavescens]
MKKLILVVLIAVLGTANTFASVPVETPAQKLRSEIIKLLDAPRINLEKEETIANIEFTLNSKNEIVVLSVESDNSQVERYVKNELNYQKVNGGIESRKKLFKLQLKIMKP